jgi:hypothetical protein
MSYGSLLTSTTLTSITTEQFFSVSGSQLIALEPGEWAAMQVEADFPVTPTDHLIVAIYPTIDGGTTYANTPDREYIVDKGTDPNRFPFIVSGYPGFRVGVRRSGATDTITSAILKLKKSGVSL